MTELGFGWARHPRGIWHVFAPGAPYPNQSVCGLYIVPRGKAVPTLLIRPPADGRLCMRCTGEDSRFTTQTRWCSVCGRVCHATDGDLAKRHPKSARVACRGSYRRMLPRAPGARR